MLRRPTLTQACRLCWAVGLALLSISLQAVAPIRTVRVAVFPHRPAIFQDPTDQQVKGFYVDMLREVADQEKWDLQFVQGTWSEGLDRIQKGEVDLLTSVARTPEREAYLDYGRIPSFTVWSQVYAHPKVEIHSILDLRGRRVAIMRSDVNGANFQGLAAQFGIPMTFTELGTFEDVFSAIASGQVDAGVTTNTFGYSTEPRFRVTRTPVVVNPFPIHFAVAKGRNRDLLVALDRYLEAGRGNPQSSHARIVNRWMSPEGSRELPTWVVRTLLLAIGALTLSLGVGLILRFQVRRATARIRALNEELHQELEARKAQEAERVHLEKQVLHVQKLESLGVLAGGIAHDFNNLLTAMMGHLNVARMKLPPESPTINHLDAVERIIFRTADLTRQMLAYSGKGHFVVAVQDLNQLIQEMSNLLKVSLGKKVSLSLALSLDPVMVEGDGAQLQQVVMNLVTNAGDAIGERSGTIRVSTQLVEADAAYLAQLFSGQALAPGAYVVLQVEDDGCGMSAEVQSRIFDPFFTTKTSGRGLGLSATLGIIRGHRGGLRIYSEEGKGTVFKIMLPAVQAEAPETTLRIPEQTGARSGAALVVDDEPEVLAASTLLMETLGFQVTQASDGQQAIQAVEAAPEPFQIVLLDLTMPRMDGRETLRALRSRQPELPVILCSGYSELATSSSDGPVHFLQKPFSFQDLQKKVETVLGRAGSEADL